jgi:tRNA threonylcarbamoyladenosine modification (KEOPS) complex  Pcc1 subunit
MSADGGQSVKGQDLAEAVSRKVEAEVNSTQKMRSSALMQSSGNTGECKGSVQLLVSHRA